MTSVKNHLHTVYAFIQYLIDNEILPLEILHKKIRIKLPKVLPKAIPAEDLQQILTAITTVRDQALILLLLHTGMRIGELLKVKMVDIILPERKILLPLGEKNLQGRIVYYSRAAEQALTAWLAMRNPDSDYLFYGYRGGELSYVIAWTIMRKAVQKAGLEQRGYSLHSLRHYVELSINGIRSQPTCLMPDYAWKCCKNFLVISPSISHFNMQGYQIYQGKMNILEP